MGQVWLQSAPRIGLGPVPFISPRSWNVPCVRMASRVNEASAIGLGFQSRFAESNRQEIFA
jgi:hypothetical protein